MSVRVLLLIASMFGASGVALLAAGAHAAGNQATTAGQMLLFHAPALMAGALALATGRLRAGLALPALVVMALGVTLFAGDLTLRALHGMRLFANAAPIGGLLTISGWIALAVAALVNRR